MGRLRMLLLRMLLLRMLQQQLLRKLLLRMLPLLQQNLIILVVEGIPAGRTIPVTGVWINPFLKVLASFRSLATLLTCWQDNLAAGGRWHSALAAGGRCEGGLLVLGQGESELQDPESVAEQNCDRCCSSAGLDPVGLPVMALECE